MNREVKKKKDPEAETADMFAVCNRLREVEKCCANCKFCKHGWEGEVSCKHPTLTYVDEYGEPWKADLGAKIAPWTVCDLWQNQEKRRRSKILTTQPSYFETKTKHKKGNKNIKEESENVL